MLGITSTEITELAVTGIRLFFIGYLFMGINFIYITSFQAIGKIKLSNCITLYRGLILLITVPLVSAQIKGVNGVWLALTIAEAIVTFVLLYFFRFKILSTHTI